MRNIKQRAIATLKKALNSASSQSALLAVQRDTIRQVLTIWSLNMSEHTARLARCEPRQTFHAAAPLKLGRRPTRSAAYLLRKPTS